MSGAEPPRRVDIIPAKRRAMILEWLRAHGAASIQELADAIGASFSTIRRDLDHLVESGHLERTHGGALLPPAPTATNEIEPSIIAHIAGPQKRAIGIAAAARLNPRESVIFDSSTTVLEAVRAAVARGLPMTAVTNSLDIALLCSTAPGTRVIVPGGMLRPGSPTLVGQPGDDFLATIHADVCMIGTHAITGTLLTEASLEIAALKRTMVQAARRTILLADSSKFRAPAFCRFSDITQIDEIVTDDGTPEELISGLRAQNVKVTVVSVDPTANG